MDYMDINNKRDKNKIRSLINSIDEAESYFNSILENESQNGLIFAENRLGKTLKANLPQLVALAIDNFPMKSKNDEYKMFLCGDGFSFGIENSSNHFYDVWWLGQQETLQSTELYKSTLIGQGRDTTQHSIKICKPSEVSSIDNIQSLGEIYTQLNSYFLENKVKTVNSKIMFPEYSFKQL